ncbi:MAG: cupin domain-containing protein [Rhizobiales bacterium]|nr:cupin domain-containing protein [Hyphomicrobiales bacterium]NRB15568.1 cupin domain-containing protein [Hyphomicrobiales bacterium]
MTADQIIAHLNLKPHPEGGHYRQTWVAAGAGRTAGTCIYFLLKAGEVSHWHHVDATEIWHYYAGAPAIISISKTDTGPRQDQILGPDLIKAQRPQVIVPPHYWQSTISTGDYTLVGCTVSPAFMFEGFVLAEADFNIPHVDTNNGANKNQR